MTELVDAPLPSHGPDLTGKVALVTGTTSGLGRRFALILANQGAKVAITGRRVERLDTLKAEIEALGGTALPISLDVTSTESVISCIDQVEQELGPIDILVNNAGMNVQALSTELSEEDYDQLMATNVKGVYFTAREAAKRMMARKLTPENGARIINIASMGAHSVLPGLVAYCASKAAVVAMTRGMAREWARHNINVNAMCPGYIETELNSEWFQSEGGAKQLKGYPRRRLGDVSDVDGALFLLASPESGFITGTSLNVDDGQSL